MSLLILILFLLYFSIGYYNIMWFDILLTFNVLQINVTHDKKRKCKGPMTFLEKVNFRTIHWLYQTSPNLTKLYQTSTKHHKTTHQILTKSHEPSQTPHKTLQWGLVRIYQVLCGFWDFERFWKVLWFLGFGQICWGFDMFGEIWWG